MVKKAVTFLSFPEFATEHLIEHLVEGGGPSCLTHTRNYQEFCFFQRGRGVSWGKEKEQSLAWWMEGLLERKKGLKNDEHSRTILFFQKLETVHLLPRDPGWWSWYKGKILCSSKIILLFGERVSKDSVYLHRVRWSWAGEVGSAQEGVTTGMLPSHFLGSWEAQGWRADCLHPLAPFFTSPHPPTLGIPGGSYSKQFLYQVLAVSIRGTCELAVALNISKHKEQCD